jgi:hypothetical protein
MSLFDYLDQAGGMSFLPVFYCIQTVSWRRLLLRAVGRCSCPLAWCINVFASRPSDAVRGYGVIVASWSLDEIGLMATCWIGTNIKAGHTIARSRWIAALAFEILLWLVCYIDLGLIEPHLSCYATEFNSHGEQYVFEFISEFQSKILMLV